MKFMDGTPVPEEYEEKLKRVLAGCDEVTEQDELTSFEVTGTGYIPITPVKPQTLPVQAPDPIPRTPAQDKNQAKPRQIISYKTVVCPKCECEHEVEITYKDIVHSDYAVFDEEESAEILKQKIDGWNALIEEDRARLRRGRQ